MRIPINFNHLYYFYVIAKEGSIVNACKVLHLTQSTLSNQLKEFEESLGAKLFDRYHKKLVLNQQGEEAFRYASGIFSGADSFVTRIRNKASGPEMKVISIGILPSLSTGLVHYFLSPLFKSKGLFTRIYEGDLESLIKKMETLEIDAILSDTPIQGVKNNFAYSQVFSTELVFISSAQQAHLQNNFPSSMNNLPFFHFSPKTQIRRMVDHFLADHHVEPRAVGEADDIAYIIMGVTQNNLLAAIPETSINDSNRNQLAILGKNLGLKIDIWFTIREQDPVSTIFQETLNLQWPEL